jgi:AraC family transcriptional regulator
MKKNLMSKEETLKYYENKVKDVVLYIQNNLDKDLNVKTLAEQANISFFHFHRIVKACLGVPLGNFINHLRLDTAAKIIRYSDENVNQIALRVGYNDLSAFSKSFTREFGVSPSAYRMNSENSINSSIDFHYNKNTVEKYKLNPKIKIVSECQVAFIAIKGEYGGVESLKTWDILLDFAIGNKILGWNKEAFSIYYDDPEFAGRDNCLFDCCLTIKKNVKPSGLVNIKQIEGGKYLVFRYKGPYENLWDVYNLIFQEYIIFLNKYRLRDSPVFEKYIKYSAKTKPENLITEIYLPIE